MRKIRVAPEGRPVAPGKTLQISNDIETCRKNSRRRSNPRRASGHPAGDRTRLFRIFEFLKMLRSTEQVSGFFVVELVGFLKFFLYGRRCKRFRHVHRYSRLDGFYHMIFFGIRRQ